MTTNIDAYTHSMARFGEQQSGETVRLFYGEDAVTAALIGGGGDAIQTGVLAGMVASMFGSVFSHPISAEQAVATVLDMLPAECSDPVWFTVAQMREDGRGYLARFSMPEAVLLRRGHAQPLLSEKQCCGSCVFEETHLRLKSRDTLVCFGSGVARAGDDVPYASGWQDTLLPAYLEAAYIPSIPARRLGELLLHVSGSLSRPEPRYDLSVAVLRYRANRRGTHAML